MAKTNQLKLAELDVVSREGRNKARAVVLFHGYGADQFDLLPLAEMMDPKGEYTWYFPNGPLELIMGPGFSGRAWFNIDMAAIEKAMREGTTRDMSGQRPAGIDAALRQATECVKQIQSRHQEVIVGGFSQGAMLATELCFTLPQKPRGLVILSGNLIDKGNWKKLSALAKSVPFIQSHGEQDAILGIKGAQSLYELLTEVGMQGEFIQFRGGHEIPLNVIQQVGRFIQSV